MTVGRNTTADLEAIAAMPGLGDLARVMENHFDLPKGTDALSMLVFLAGRWTGGGANQLTSQLKTTNTWGDVRASAARVDRHLPKKPPTHDQLRHLRDGASPQAFEAVAAAFTPSQVDLVQSIGLLDPKITPRYDQLRRENTIYGDGTVFKSLSDVTVDAATGEIIGSRANGTGTGARIPDRYYGKRRKDQGASPGAPGLPIAMIGVHGDHRWQRAVLGLSMYFDRNEVGAALRLFDQVHSAHGPAVHALVYDRLLSGRHLQKVMRHGVVPIVDMPEPGKHDASIPVPVGDLRNLLGRKGRPKNAVKIAFIDTVTHEIGSRTCAHALWAVDGVLVTCAPADAEPSFDHPVARQTALRFEGHPEGQHLFGDYRIPCRHGHLRYQVDMSASRGKPQRDGQLAGFADLLRPLEMFDAHLDVRGWRSDVESLFRHVKSQLPMHGRASSHGAHHFLLDVVGAALLTNAVAWDVHASQHTRCGQAGAKSLPQKRAPKPNRRRR